MSFFDVLNESNVELRKSESVFLSRLENKFFPVRVTLKWYFHSELRVLGIKLLCARVVCPHEDGQELSKMC